MVLVSGSADASTGNTALIKDDALNALNVQASDRRSLYVETAWQLNRCAVFMNSTRTVLEDLMAMDSAEAAHIHKLFKRRYTEHVDAALKNGTILKPLDIDDAVTTTMPRTQLFIRNVLTFRVGIHAEDGWVSP